MKQVVFLIVFALWFACAVVGVETPLELADIDGTKHQPLAAKDSKATVLLFIAPDCPISNGYAPEIMRIVKEYQPKRVSFYLVYVDPDQETAAIKRHVEQYQLSLPALLDPKHLLVTKAGASVTPEAVVISPAGKTVYRGRIDDIYLDFGKRQEKARERNLRDALEAILAGKPVAVPETKAVGCYISK